MFSKISFTSFFTQFRKALLISLARPHRFRVTSWCCATYPCAPFGHWNKNKRKMVETTRGPLGDWCPSEKTPPSVFLTLSLSSHILQQPYGFPMTHEGEGFDPNTGHVPEQAKLDFTNALCGTGPKQANIKTSHPEQETVFCDIFASARDGHYVPKHQMQLGWRILIMSVL